jgi:hypothetical protein
MQPTSFKRNRQSIAGAILIALGVLTLRANLDRSITEFIHVLGVIPRQVLGILPALVVAAARVVRAYTGNRECFLQTLTLHTLASAWPLLLVAVGAILVRDSLAD